MRFVCAGLNHQTAPVGVRERLAVPDHRIGEVVRHLAAHKGVGEVVVLSTCNRVECYAAADDARTVGAALLSVVAGGEDGLEASVYLRSPGEAERHLIEVAAGLDSMVLGETEIFGQVKRAYALAREAGTTGPITNRIFQRGFAVAKKVRTQTAIQRGSTSVGSVAVDLAERIFGALRDCKVMLLGAGEMSRTTAKSLLGRGARSIIVSNRSHDRALEMAAEMGGEALRFDAWPERMGEVDIVIASTGAPHYVVSVDQVQEIRRRRRGRPLFLIDIAVPRNIDPAVNRVDDVYLYDIDALQVLAAEGRAQREAQIAACRQIIEEEIERYTWRQRPPGAVLEEGAG